MKKTPYGRKRWIPDKCPDCGKGFKSDIPSSKSILYDALHESYMGFTKEYLFDEKWGMRRWFAVCRNCDFLKIIRNPYSFLSKVQKHDQLERESLAKDDN